MKMLRTAPNNFNTKSKTDFWQRSKRNNFQTHLKPSKNKCCDVLLFLLITCAISHLSSAKSNCPSACECTDARTFCVGQKIKTFINMPASVIDVYLFNNNISNIPRRIFQPLNSIKILDLASNSLTDASLWDGIFTSKKTLEHIDLTQNKISKIKNNLVSGLPNLERLYLQNNLISTIEQGAFNNLTKLVELKLSNNLLRSFPALKSTPNLLLIDATRNLITKLHHEAFARVNLEKLMLGQNRLTEFRNIFDVVNRLEHLDISSNRLTAVPRTIRSLRNLISLNISHNSIAEIPVDTFTQYSSLKDLDITSMSLTTLQREVIPSKIILNFFRLGNNRWNCDCDLFWLYDFIANVPVMFDNPASLKCASPSHIRGKRLDQIVVGRDVKCEGVRPGVPNIPSSTTMTTTTRRRNPAANACDVYDCANGGTCSLTRNYMPVCRCRDGFSGPQCRTEKYRPTTKPTTTTKSANNQPKSALMVNPDSITENSVQIILPRASTDLTVRVKEKLPSGKTGVETNTKIQPKTNMYTIQGLEAGRTYNICITTADDMLKHDVLCGIVKMKGLAIYEKPSVVVPSLNPVETTTDKTIAQETKVAKNPVNMGENDSSVNAKRNGELGYLYPALGVGCGVLIILIILLLFFMCYRNKRSKINKKHPQNNNTDTIYIPGGQSDMSLQTRYIDMEMSPMCKHGSRGNSLKNGALLTNGRSSPRKGSQNHQQMNYIPQRQAATPNSSSGSSSNSNCGTLPPRSMDNSYHYQHTPVNGSIKRNGEVAFIPSQQDMRNGEFVYRTSSQSSPTHALHAQHFDGEDMRPLMMQQHSQMSMQQPQYYPPEPTTPIGYIPPNTMPQQRMNYPPITSNSYTYQPRSDVIGYVGDMGTPHHHQQPYTTRSAFQPLSIQHTHASPMTMASQCAPVMTHVNTAHVIPVTSGMGMIGNEHLYQEGVA